MSGSVDGSSRTSGGPEAGAGGSDSGEVGQDGWAVQEVLRPPLMLRLVLGACGLVCMLGAFGAAANLSKASVSITAARLAVLVMVTLIAALSLRRRTEISRMGLRVVDGLRVWQRPWRDITALLQYRSSLVVLAGTRGCRIAWLGARERDRLLRAVLQRAGLRVSGGALPSGALALFRRCRLQNEGRQGSGT